MRSRQIRRRFSQAARRAVVSRRDGVPLLNLRGARMRHRRDFRRRLADMTYRIEAVSLLLGMFGRRFPSLSIATAGRRALPADTPSR